MANSSSSSLVRLCQVGAGRIGTFRIGLFKDSKFVKCVAVVERDQANAVWTKPSLDGPTPFTSIAEVNVPFDAIWISSPTKFHPALIEQAAQRTKFIYCEKPIAPTPKEVQKCYALCKEKGVELLCGWMRRFDDGYSTLFQELTASNVDVAAAHLVSKDWPKASPQFLRTLGSIFTDLMCHDFNLACLFMKDELPISVEAHGKDTTRIGIWDSASCILEYSEGRFVFIEAHRYSDTCKYENFARIYTPSGKVYETKRGQDTFSFMERYTKAFTAEVGFFSKVVRGEPVQRRNTEKSCVVTSTLIDLAEKSAKSGKKLFVRDYNSKL